MGSGSRCLGLTWVNLNPRRSPHPAYLTTLPSKRDDQLRWRRVTLRRVHRERVRAERLRLLRRILTLGLWRR